MSVETKAAFTVEELKAIEAIPIYFVVGKERSGTTLLQIILNSHPNIIAPPESRFIIFLHARYGSIKRWSEETITSFCNDLYREGLFREFWGIDKNDLFSVLLSLKDKLTFSLACKIIFWLSAPEKKDVSVFVDKNPIYYYFLPELEAIFKNAKYIHIVRDYRANIVSHRKTFRIKTPADLAYRWVKVNKLIGASKLRNRERYFTLKYESLVQNPKIVLRELCAFLSIPFSEKMSEDHTSSIFLSFKEHKKPKFRKRHKSIFEPLDTSHIDEWKAILLPEEIAQSEAIAGEYGEKEFGYGIAVTKKERINIVRLLFIRMKFAILMFVYRTSFRNLSLYYFIKRKIWIDF